MAECIEKAFDVGVKRKVLSNCKCLLFDNCKICDCPLPPGYPYEESQVGIFRQVNDKEIVYFQCSIKGSQDAKMLVHGRNQFSISVKIVPD